MQVQGARGAAIASLAAGLLLAACATGPSVQGSWGAKFAKEDCKSFGATITATTLSIKLAGSALDEPIDLKEDSQGADADVYLLSDRDLSQKINAVYPIRMTLQNDELTFSSNSDEPLGKAWLNLLTSIQPLHRCPNT